MIDTGGYYTFESGGRPNLRPRKELGNIIPEAQAAAQQWSHTSHMPNHYPHHPHHMPSHSYPPPRPNHPRPPQRSRPSQPPPTPPTPPMPPMPPMHSGGFGPDHFHYGGPYHSSGAVPSTRRLPPQTRNIQSINKVQEEMQPDELNDRELLCASPYVYGFSLGSKTWSMPNGLAPETFTLTLGQAESTYPISRTLSGRRMCFRSW